MTRKQADLKQLLGERNGLAIAHEDNPLAFERAQVLARKLHLLINQEAQERLWVTTDAVMLQIAPFSPICADFTQSTWQKRRDAGKQQGLIQACKPRPGMRIIDTTAGWGRDGAILASFGAQVLLLERHAVMAELLADGIARQDARSKEVLQVSLLHVDAKDYLQLLAPGECPELIYIDGMHPQRSKASLVKKELQVLQQLIGPDDDIGALLAVALQKATQSVVVKWPSSLKPLGQPTRSVIGKTIRFDVYSSPLKFKG